MLSIFSTKRRKVISETPRKIHLLDVREILIAEGTKLAKEAKGLSDPDSLMHVYDEMQEIDDTLKTLNRLTIWITKASEK